MPFLNLSTGKTDTARPAGDPLRWLRQFGANAVAITRGEPVQNTVPCAGCTECCYHKGVDVHPEAEPPDRLAHLALEWKADQQSSFLQKREDGACIHLGPTGCTVYDHRPNACRHYDCHVHALTGVLDTFDGNHVQPTWLFQPRSPQARAFMATCLTLGQTRFLKTSQDGKPASAPEIAEYALSHPNFHELATAFLSVANADPETQKKLLGFDPRTITTQQLTESFQAIATRRD